MTAIVVSMDIGTSEIRTLVAQILSGSVIDIIGVGKAESQGIEGGYISNLEGALQSTEKSLSEAQRSAGVKIKEAVININGPHFYLTEVEDWSKIAPKNTPGPPIISSSDISDLLRKASLKTTLADYIHLHTLPQRFTINRNYPVNNPIGLYGSLLEVKALLVFAPMSLYLNLQKLLVQLGIKASQFIYSPLAAEKAVLTDSEKSGGVTLIDLGAGTTGLAVYQDDAIHYLNVIDEGGENITREILYRLKVNTHTAKELKHTLTDGTATHQDNSYSDYSTSPTKITNSETVRSIITEKYRELFQRIMAELSRLPQLTGHPVQVVLTGGGAKFKGAVSLAEEIFGCPARVGIPIGFAEHNEDWKDPSFATSVGLIRSLLFPSLKSSPEVGEPKLTLWRKFKRTILHRALKRKSCLITQ